MLAGVGGIAVVLTLVLTSVVALARPANAAAYRYWSYWWASDGSWAFATAGPVGSLPEDGSVEGWRFGITGLSGNARDAPAIDPVGAFERACGGTPIREGRKRVAVVIDPGTAADAPPGNEPGQATVYCASVEEAATGYQVLRSILEVRTEDGLVCAIGGYPKVGCAEFVADQASASASSASASSASVSSAPAPAAPAGSSPDSTSPDSTGPGPFPLVIAGLAIGAMLGFIWRRRRTVP